jgi:hypothetical protein
MGCVGFQANHHGSLGNEGTHHSHHSQYDPSYTSATVHSLDSNQLPLTVHEIEVERRPSNFYIFDDDSTHEFDDEIAGVFMLQSFTSKHEKCYWNCAIKMNACESCILDK